MKSVYTLILSIALLSCKSNTDEKKVVANLDTISSRSQKIDSIQIIENSNNDGENVEESNRMLKKVNLPFDFQKYMDLCYLEENAVCDKEFPFYKADELPAITSLINEKVNKNTPDKIYSIENGSLNFETYIFSIRDETEDYFQKKYLINVRNGKIISSQEIGRNIDGEAPEDVDVTDKTFIIDKDLTISIFDKVYKKKNKLLKKYKITSDGTIELK